MGRPTADAQNTYSWASLEEVSKAGVRREHNADETPMCMEDFIKYYTSDTCPHYERGLV
jgi:hypothetical protein